MRKTQNDHLLHTSDTEDLSTLTFFSYDGNGNMISDGTYPLRK